MRLLTLPSELLLGVAEHLKPHDLGALIITLPNYDELLIPLLDAAIRKSLPINTVCWAAKNGYTDLLGKLLDSGQDVGTRDSTPPTPLHWAATYGHVSAMKLLVDRGCKINAHIDEEWRMDDGNTAFHSAAMCGQESPLRFLLGIGVNIDLQNLLTGRTALHIAANSGKAAVAAFLLSQGAKTESRDISNMTPLSIAVGNVYLDVVRVLLEGGADATVLDSSRHTLLHRVFVYERSQNTERACGIARLLLEAGVDINAQDVYGRTVLDQVSSGPREGTKGRDFLLEFGADTGTQRLGSLDDVGCRRLRG